MNPKVSIIVVSYNTANIISKCLHSLLNQAGISYEIIIIDNASEDNTKEVLDDFGDQIKVIYSKENLGFGKANNLVFNHYTKGDYILMFNPDAQFRKSDDLFQLIKYIENKNSIGLLGVALNENKKIVSPNYSYPGEKYTKADFQNLPGAIAWVIGAVMLIPREVFLNTRGFDEDFFLYGEETDLCLRIRQAGYSIDYSPDIIVDHIGGVSEKKSTNYDLSYRKQLALQLFYQKHYSKEQINQIIHKEYFRCSYKYKINQLLFIFNRSPQKF